MAKTNKKPSFLDEIQAHAGAIIAGTTPPKVAAAQAKAALDKMSPKERAAFLNSIPEYSQANASINQLGLTAQQLLAGFSFVKDTLLPNSIGLEQLRAFQQKSAADAESAVRSAETRLRNAQVKQLGAQVFGTLLDDPDDALVQLFEAEEERKRKAAARKAKKNIPAAEEANDDEDENEDNEE